MPVLAATQPLRSTLPALHPVPADPPWLIQGGMGVGVSGWALARAVARTGQLGVVSGTALDVVLVRTLQLGDPGGHVRRALAAFPARRLAHEVRLRYFRPQGLGPGERHRPSPRLRAEGGRDAEVLTVLGNFVQVWLAKQGHQGPVGVNYLEKIQLATAPAMFGAMLAGVDYVLVGAGLPRQIPTLATRLSRYRTATTLIDVVGDEAPLACEFDPVALLGADVGRPPLRRPDVLAIVSLPVLAAYLAKDEGTRPDGFVVEMSNAGGHSAAPRGAARRDATGEPVYGPRDEPDLAKVAALGLPFWLAGGQAGPQQLAAARAAGAAGVQVGSAFALCEESGMAPMLRRALRTRATEGTLRVRNDPDASPTGFPFKVADLPGTMSDPRAAASRTRVCDLGFLRTPVRRADGGLDYRCSAEPIAAYVRKGGQAVDTAGRVCLCNGLLASVGLGQRRPGGREEPALLTLGKDLGFLAALAPEGDYRAEDVVRWIGSGIAPSAEHPPTRAP
ncbi:NAD(P)H-dependent flavin oxidoreductase YrpB (nitropropane dioxygenase family) [Streptacidiphilus sp. MAP12-33]|uniref:nitronate monooxygenase n=1 Tax=Streptacidiphilus sp. MAP12-33 TaxID=3156266 RepID=UPI003512B28B